jgi:hypothetical protein
MIFGIIFSAIFFEFFEDLVRVSDDFFAYLFDEK